MRTIHVRIPIAVTHEGGWFARGREPNEGESESEADARAKRQVIEEMEAHELPGIRVSWIEADVPLPEPEEVTVEARKGR